MTKPKNQREWEKEFNEKFKHCISKKWSSHMGAITSGQLEYDNIEARVAHIKQFIRTQIEQARRETAENICNVIDDIELSYRDTSMEEWKAFKHIRNTIRDKYVLDQIKKGET